MPRNKPKKWTDGLKGEKTATHPKGGGRVKGRIYAHLVSFPGILAEMRMAWSRMKAQAKFREKQGRAGEAWYLTWEEFLDIWDTKWHLRGTSKESYVLTKINQEGSWSLDNVEVCPRLEQWRRQVKTPSSNLGKKYRPRKSKV